MNSFIHNTFGVVDPPGPGAAAPAEGSDSSRRTDGLSGSPLDLTTPERPEPRFEALRRAREALAGVGFAALSLVIRAAIRAYFGRVRVFDADRVPRRGAVLLVANHPAMWTDVLVLDVAARRKLHFLAQGQLFHPAARAAILRLHGALPLIASPARSEDRSRNRETFQRCLGLFQRGDAVALFPEGVSLADRTVLPLKTGAARLALTAAATLDPGSRPQLIPAGIHYACRTAWGSEVTVSFDTPIPLAVDRAPGAPVTEDAVLALTERIHGALRSLILDLPDPGLATAVADLDALAAMGEPPGTSRLERSRRIASWLASERLEAPERFARILRHVRAYRRARHALRLGDRALATGRDARPHALAPRHAAVALLVAPFAALGALLHTPAWALGEWIAHRVGRHDPTRFTFGRIASGLVLIPAEYALAFAWLAWGPTHWPVPRVLAILAAGALLGSLALRVAPHARALRQRLRLAALDHRHHRLVHRARREQRRLRRVLRVVARRNTARTDPS